MTEIEKLTHTKRRNYKNCHRLFYYRHEQRLTTRVQRPSRRRGANFGSVIYRVQVAEEEGTLSELLKQPIPLKTLFRNFVEECVEDLYEHEHPDSQEEADALALERTILAEIALAYIKTYGIDKRREVVYESPLINPLTGRAMRAFRIAGKIDGVEPQGNKHARIIEDKLVGQIQKVMIDRLPLDDQITEYVDALVREGWTAEVDYRHTRWPGINPLPPKEFKKKPNYSGESLDEFGERLAQDLIDRHDFYFDRQTLRFSTEHLEEFRLQRWQVAKDIMQRRLMGKKIGRGAWFKNPSHCFEFGGCPYIPLCVGMEGAEDLYVIEDSSDPELEVMNGGSNGEHPLETAA